MRLTVPFAAMLLWSATCFAAGTDSILNSVHNLSVGGPGIVRATSEQQVCIFCHTPHNATPVQPLWNRLTPPNAYRPYTSNSLQAVPGQPTGTSKLCLSCHDGTIALGSVVSRFQPIAMAGGMMTLPPGRSNLGTDLSDDHPISFRYDNTLAGKDPKLVDPATLPEKVRLDPSLELQCTTCHDAHDNTFGRFLVMDNSASQLCNACHQISTTTVASHQQCNACHQQHTAPSGPYLLRLAKVADTCNNCHNPNATANNNIMSEIQKISTHDTSPVVNLPTHVPDNATCTNCHGPHTMKTEVATAPQVPGNFGQVPGVNVSGSPVNPAQFEYEVCFQCHGDQQGRQAYISRVHEQANTRLEFNTTAISYHPVVNPGRNNDVPSLRPGLTVSSVISCNDCHGSDTSRKAGGAGANGPHGSNYPPLLIARYDTTDHAAESSSAYALCYRCHERTSILGNQSFSKHKEHIVDHNTPCSVCHDPHGIASVQGTATSNSHLINFDTTVVTKNTLTMPQFKDNGFRAGSCNLTCHNKVHTDLQYPNP